MLAGNSRRDVLRAAMAAAAAGLAGSATAAPQTRFQPESRNMPMSLQEISDRLEIEDLLNRYSDAIDTRDWEAYAAVFTDDAVIDYTSSGGPRGGVAEMQAYLPKALTKIVSAQHVISNILLTFDGDRARGKTTCQCPMVVDLGNGKTQTFFQGLWYHDRLVRTAKGWRLAERVEEDSYKFNLPEGFKF